MAIKLIDEVEARFPDNTEMALLDFLHPHKIPLKPDTASATLWGAAELPQLVAMFGTQKEGCDVPPPIDGDALSHDNYADWKNVKQLIILVRKHGQLDSQYQASICME